MNLLIAKQISAEARDGYRQVAFAEDADGAGRYLIIQLADSFDDQDRAAGMDGPCLEIDAATQGGYRSIIRIEVLDRRIIIWFSESAHGLAPGSSPIVIECADGSGDLAALIPMLRDIAARAAIAFSDTSKITLPYFDNAPALFDVEQDAEQEQDESAQARASAALAAFLRLSVADRDADTRHVYAYCQGFVTSIGAEEDMPMPDNPLDIWQRVMPEVVVVYPDDGLDQNAYVLVHAACDWEPEHGLQMVWRGGTELVRVSGIDGHVLNSAFQGDDVIYADPLLTFTTRKTVTPEA